MKEADRVNDVELVQKHNYKKLSYKILAAKIKKYASFYKPDVYQNLLSQALREAGTKGYKSPNVMTLMADFNSKKGDHDKGTQYIERAQKLANEVLDGVKSHQKYVSILGMKSDILLRKK
jgi:hypothetical protein